VSGVETNAVSQQLDKELGVVSKLECVDPEHVLQQQKSSITSFTWDSTFCSDVIEMTAQNRCLLLKEE